MTDFFTPTGYSGTAELTVSNGLSVTSQGSWLFSRPGYNDGATFGLSLGYPNQETKSEYFYGSPSRQPGPLSGGVLRVQAQNWPIAVIGNELTDYVGEDSVFYPASQCRIVITGRWNVVRQQNSNSFNSFGIIYAGYTHTDLGNRDAWGFYQTVRATYVIQGAAVTGGAQNTFSSHLFYCEMTEQTTSDNSNFEYQSNTVSQPVWAYSYSKSWQTTPAP